MFIDNVDSANAWFNLTLFHYLHGVSATDNPIGSYYSNNLNLAKVIIGLDEYHL